MERMGSSLKRPRLQNADEAAEEVHDLVKLVHRRAGDVQEFLTHLKTKEDELAKALEKLHNAETLLEQFRASSRAMQADRNQNPAIKREDTSVDAVDNQTPSREVRHVRASPSSAKKSAAANSPSKASSRAKQGDRNQKREDTSLNAVNNQTPSREVPHVRASPSLAKKSAAAESPSTHPTKTSGGASASRPVDLGPSSADRGKKKSSKRASGVEENSKKAKGAVQREYVDLISMIRNQSKPTKLDVAFPVYVPNHHKRKPRSLVMSPAIDHLCATSALDGVVNFWQITQDKAFGLNLSHNVDCISPGQRRWPEDLAWHPHGETLFAVYTADGGPQIGIIKTSKAKSGNKPRFLEDKPHEKGIINTIEFMPWSNGSQFVTGGCDHGVVLWTETEKKWHPRLLHRTLHSSAVTGVGGIPNKNFVISSGMDKRVFAIDPSHGRSTFAHQLESKALGVAPNPADCNLVMVQTGTPGQQLRLFDIRVQRTELHCFGWKQLAGDAQSGYISQSWSPDGLYCASGSTDPKIHVFDIRYNSKEPVQTFDAHQKRVFKAAWHPSLPLMLSISSDLFIGIHKIF
ncbi:hypothetical protein M758_3G131100 [Ceratodon purpureus]|nr:hypothetical protein M758_3G131100 [Ceratodon purpureus]